MKKKKKIAAAAVITAAVMIVAVLVVYAYFSAFEGKDNTLTPADNTIEISEDYVPPAEQGEGSNIYKKQISVVNSSNAKCYIRVYMDFSDSGVRARSYLSNDPDQSAESFYSANRSTEGNTYIANLGTQAPKWEFIPDNDTSSLAGYYYYTEPVLSGESTEPLMTYVKTINANADEIKQYDIVVYSESIQTTGMDGYKYTDYKEAWTATLG